MLFDDLTSKIPEASFEVNTQTQVINYLKATGIEIGLLVNFGNPKLEYFRLHK